MMTIFPYCIKTVKSRSGSGNQGKDIVTAKGTSKLTPKYEYILNKIGQGTAITKQLRSVLWNTTIIPETKTHI